MPPTPSDVVVREPLDRLDRRDQHSVEGDLTIRDVTKRITVPVSFLWHRQDPWGREKVAFRGGFNDQPQGVRFNWNAALETGGFLVGDDVKVTLAIQAA